MLDLSSSETVPPVITCVNVAWPRRSAGSLRRARELPARLIVRPASAQLRAFREDHALAQGEQRGLMQILTIVGDGIAYDDHIVVEEARIPGRRFDAGMRRHAGDDDSL